MIPPLRRRGYISLVAGVVITSILGASYAYSVYKSALEKLWGSSFYATIPFSVFIATFAFTSMLGSRFYVKKGIKLTTTLSISLVSLGLKLSSLVEEIINPLYMVFTYGILTGLGNGFGYVPVVALARRWFPDKAGFATGIVVLGYGGSSLYFAPLKAWLLENLGLRTMFIVTGLISAALGIPASLILRDPEPEVITYYSRFSKRRVFISKKDLEPRSMLKTVDYWIIWISYILVSGAGLMFIGHLARIANLKGFGVLESTIAVSIFASMNALGRPPSGWISDKVGRPVTMAIIFAIQSIAFFLLAYTSHHLLEFYVLVAIAGFTYGSTLSLYPAITGDFFGLKHLSENYAIVFTGWGLGGLIFPTIGGYLRDLTGGYTVALISFGLSSLIGALMNLYLKNRLKHYLE